MQLAQPLLTGRAIDIIQSSGDDLVRQAVTVVILLFLLDAGSGLLNNINGYIGDRLSAKLHKILAEKYFAHLLVLPQAYFDEELSGKIISRLNRGTHQISLFINMFANNFLQFVLTTVFALILVARFSWVIALLLLSLYPVFIVMTIKTSAKWQKWQARRNKYMDIASGRFAEAVGQVKVVKSFIQESHELSTFSKLLGKHVQIGKPQSKYWHKRDIERRFVLALIFLVVYLLIFIGAARGTFTAGQAITMILLAFQIRIPIFSISFLVDNTQRAIADSKDYFEVMSMKPLIRDSKDAETIIVTDGAISYQNVQFNYINGDKVLNSLSFDIQPGEKIALVGESGEGKTTITSLLMRLYEPTGGTIKIDNQDIKLVTQESLRSNIGVVFQEAALFSGTIKENIAYSNVYATDEAIEAAAKSANAHEFITKFEKGYDTEIGERGLKLSGGQKQRIAIARALLKDAPILVLDEATSSLDNKSEVLVQQALNRLMKGRTTIIIAHRLSTIQNVDKIITLKNGVVDEIGTPRQLASSGGIYEQLLEINTNIAQEKSKKKLRAYDINV